jgi:NADH:ubiquinone oxidoreductase subunit F (NADH-binding)
MGGFFGGVLHPDAGSIELSYDTLRAAGSSLGCGAVHVLGPDGCVVAAAAEIMGFFDRENARQCGACIRGTNAMAAAFLGLARGEATDSDMDRLRSWSVSLRGRGDCATLDGAATLAGTVLAGFPQVVAEHLTSACRVCAQSLSARSLTMPLLTDASAERAPTRPDPTAPKVCET